MTRSVRTIAWALPFLLVGAAAPAAAEELRQGLLEQAKRDAELSKVTRPSEGQVMSDGSVRYGSMDGASVTMTIKNPCPPGDIAHEMAVPLPGRGRR